VVEEWANQSQCNFHGILHHFWSHTNHDQKSAQGDCLKIAQRTKPNSRPAKRLFQTAKHYLAKQLREAVEITDLNACKETTVALEITFVNDICFLIAVGEILGRDFE